jgi:ribosome-binding factor A
VILQELSVAVRDLKDPRVVPLTFTRAEVTQDGSQATVFVLPLGAEADDPRMKDCVAGLTSASGFLRRHLGRALDVRHIPRLIFKADKGLANANRVYDLLKKI